jgi:CBS domain-containing membrane protein
VEFYPYQKSTGMKKNEPVSSIMTKDVITVDYKDSLDTAERFFKTKYIRHIPVVKNNKIDGMLSYTDLLRISFADSVLDVDGDPVTSQVYDLFTIEHVMAKNIVSVSPTTTIKETAEILAKREFHAIPVVDDDKLVGIVTTTDLIKYLLKQY